VKRHEPLFMNLSSRCTAWFQIRSVILVLVNLKPARRSGLFFYPPKPCAKAGHLQLPKPCAKAGHLQLPKPGTKAGSFTRRSLGGGELLAALIAWCEGGLLAAPEAWCIGGFNLPYPLPGQKGVSCIQSTPSRTNQFPLVIYAWSGSKTPHNLSP
jgi:hypothetical protein